MQKTGVPLRKNLLPSLSQIKHTLIHTPGIIKGHGNLGTGYPYFPSPATGTTLSEAFLTESRLALRSLAPQMAL